MLQERFHVSQAILGCEHWSEPLTGNLFCFSATDFVYLFFELEKTFKVSIPHGCLNSYGLSSINKIAEVIKGCTPSQLS